MDNTSGARLLSVVERLSPPQSSHTPQSQVINRLLMQRSVAYVKLQSRASLGMRLTNGQNKAVDRNKHRKFDLILMILVCGFDLRLLLSFGGMLAVWSREVSPSQRFQMS